MKSACRMSISDAEVAGALQISPAGYSDAEFCSRKQQANSDVQIPLHLPADNSAG